jgi:integrase/recombinase XerC
MELFFFDRNALEMLPEVEHLKFNDLLRKVVLPLGRPFFLNEDGLPDWELDGFCTYLLAPRRKSAKTWKTYAIQILVFLRFMTSQGKEWKDAVRVDLNRYYTVRTTGEFQSSEKLTARSWNIAATAIVHLYEYALDEKLIEKLPFKYRKSRSSFAGSEAMTADIGAKFDPEPINFISMEHYKNIWRPKFIVRRNTQRNLVLVDLLISTGLRISEALNLSEKQIPNPDDKIYAERKSIKIRVIGKGGKSRMVTVSKQVVRAMRFYIEEDRATSISQGSIGADSKVKSQKRVFLTEKGNPLQARSVQDLFMTISKETGLKLTPHGCRHTFAVYQLEAMIKRMSKNLKEIKDTGFDAYRQMLSDPLRELQRLLGHSHITSTYVYLDFLDESEALVDESLDDWINWVEANGK